MRITLSVPVGTVVRVLTVVAIGAILSYLTVFGNFA